MSRNLWGYACQSYNSTVSPPSRIRTGIPILPYNLIILSLFVILNLHKETDFRKASALGWTPPTNCASPAQFTFKQGATDMGDKGKKDKGKREQQKKAQLSKKEKRKLKKEKKE
jgi:hypothetical protein